MELPLGNFFEVTVDSQRLSSWMQDVQRQLRVQSDRADEFSRALANVSSSVGARVKRSEQAMQEQLQRMRRGSQQESNYLRLFLKDADKKAFEKIAEFENSLVMLNNRITITRDALQDDLALRLSFFEKKLTNLPSHQDGQDLLHKELQNLQATVTALEEQLASRVQALEEARIKSEEEAAEMRRAQSQKTIARAPSLARSRKRLKSHRNATLYQNQDDIDQIVNKISQLENKLQQQRDQTLLLSNNRIVKISQNLTSVARLPGNSEETGLFPATDLASQVTTRLARLEETVVGRLAECERTVCRLSNRSQITDEQVGIVARKFQKQRVKVAEMVNGFKRLEERKIDDRAIEQLRTAIKKLGKEVEEGLEGKATRQTVQRERKTVLQRVQALAESLAEKADKSEVKRGFTFLEQKIKEMIIVLAEEKSYNKDSATKKGAFKCLSCDKELQAQPPEPSLPPRLPRDSATSSARCSTNQLRKRIRMVNNSISNDDNA